MTTERDNCELDFRPPAEGQDLNLGTRIDRNGKTTYHVLTTDRRAGVFLEKVYDQDHHLIKLQKRSRGSRSETYFDTESGAVIRIFESSTLPDGSSLTKNIIYTGRDRSSEDVIVISPNGELVRRVEREHVGMRTVFQGQTEYNCDGTPASTVNHRMDLATNRLVHREQIQWLSEQQRSLTEDFHFDHAGNLIKYSKVLYHPNSGPFLEETQEYDPANQSLTRREITGYSTGGKQTCIDTLTYNAAGEVTSRESIFFDENGNPIASRNCAHS